MLFKSVVFYVFLSLPPFRGLLLKGKTIIIIVVSLHYVYCAGNSVYMIAENINNTSLNKQLKLKLKYDPTYTAFNLISTSIIFSRQ